MELRQLRYFVVLANRLNFSQAASDLFITQGTLSQQIRQLENELGVDLFERSSHSVHLTENGAEILELAKRTLDSAQECSQKVTDLKRLLTGTLNIGVTHSFGRLVRDTIRDFVKKYPGVKINIIYNTATDLLELLRERKIDLFLAFKPAVENADIESELLFESTLSAIMASSHPLTEKPAPLTIDDLKPYPIALLGAGMQSRKAFERYVNVNTSGLNVMLEMNDPNLMLDIIAATNFVSITSSLAVSYRPGLVALPLEGISRDMLGCVHRLRDAYEKRSAKAFIELLQDSAFLARLG